MQQQYKSHHNQDQNLWYNFLGLMGWKKQSDGKIKEKHWLPDVFSFWIQVSFECLLLITLALLYKFYWFHLVDLKYSILHIIPQTEMSVRDGYLHLWLLESTQFIVLSFSYFLSREPTHSLPQLTTHGGRLINPPYIHLICKQPPTQTPPWLPL